MICKYCGNQIDDNSDFCFICGQKVNPIDAENAPAGIAVQEKYYLDQNAPYDSAPDMSQNSDIFDEPEVEVVKASKFVRVISFIFAIIGLIIYAVKKKKGKDGEAISVLNAIMTGLCVKMGAGLIYLVKIFMLPSAN